MAGAWGGGEPLLMRECGGEGGSRSLEEVVGHLNAQSTCFHWAHGGCRCRRHRGWVRTGKSALFLWLARPTPERRRETIPAAPGARRGGSLRGAASLQREPEAAVGVSDGVAVVAVAACGRFALPPIPAIGFLLHF